MSRGIDARPRKVLMLTQFLHMGGLERMIFNLATTLKARGDWEPRVFVFDRMTGASPENDLGPALVEAGVPVTERPKPPGFSPRAVLALRRTLAAESIGVIHSHDLGALIYGACAKLLSFGRVRLVHTQHSFVYLSRSAAQRRYARFFGRFADELAVVSDDTKRSFAELGFDPERIRVVPNGVRFLEKADAVGKKEKRGELLRELDAPSRAALEPFLDCRWILYMSRLHATKGQDHAMELWKRLSPGVSGRIALLFVGPGNEPGRLERLRSDIASAPNGARVLYMGATHRPELWLSCADAALSSSEFEGMPLGPIEAAGAGLPLVLSDIPGHELMKDWSRRYPLNDPAAGARRLEETVAELEAGPDDYFARRWEKASALRERYALDLMAAAYARLYSPS